MLHYQLCRSVFSLIYFSRFLLSFVLLGRWLSITKLVVWTLVTEMTGFLHRQIQTIMKSIHNTMCAITVKTPRRVCIFDTNVVCTAYTTHCQITVSLVSMKLHLLYNTQSCICVTVQFLHLTAESKLQHFSKHMDGKLKALVINFIFGFQWHGLLTTTVL